VTPKHGISPDIGECLAHQKKLPGTGRAIVSEAILDIKPEIVERLRKFPQPDEVDPNERRIF
jgi:hypothetical protein